MSIRSRIFLSIGLFLALFFACAPPEKKVASETPLGRAFVPEVIYQSASGIRLGEPLGVAVDLHGDIFVADGLPGRVIFFNAGGDSALEFQEPFRYPGFYPSDLKLQGFFLYAIDKVGRALLRFDKDGAYRDLLLNFNEAILGKRISPCGLDVDSPGRVAITDVENHQILVFDSYLSLEVAFGNYGSYPGQLDTPEGVSFTESGNLIVADSGNKRIQFFGIGGDFLREVPAEGDYNPFEWPRRAVVDKTGRIFIADPQAGRLFIFDNTGRNHLSLYPHDAVDFRPTDVEITRTGMVYVTDAASGSLFIFKVMSY